MADSHDEYIEHAADPHGRLLENCLQAVDASSASTGSFTPAIGGCIDPSVLTLDRPWSNDPALGSTGTSPFQLGDSLSNRESNHRLSAPPVSPDSPEKMKRRRETTTQESAGEAPRKLPRTASDNRENAKKLVQCWLQTCFDNEKYIYPTIEEVNYLAHLGKISFQETRTLINQELGMESRATTPAPSMVLPLSPPHTLEHTNQLPVQLGEVALIQQSQQFQPTPARRRLQSQKTSGHQSSAQGVQSRPQSQISFFGNANAISAEERERRILRNYLASRQRECNTGLRHVNNDGKFQCTSKCGFKAAVVDRWKRHEENRQPQALWICAVCRKVPPPSIPFHTHRVDKIGNHLKEHIRKNESGLSWEDLRNQSVVKFVAPFRTKCGFCRTRFDSWAQRNKHIIEHFNGERLGDRGPRDIREWNDDWDDQGGESDGDDSDGPGDDPGDGSQGGPGHSGFGNLPGDFSFDGGSPGSAGNYFGRGPGTGGASNFSSSSWNGSGQCFRTNRVLGYGSHAVVDQIELESGEKFARKRFQVDSTDQTAPAPYEREVRIMEKLKNPEHPNIVSLEGTYREESSFSLVLRPAASSDLQAYLQSPQRQQKADQLWSWMSTLASALTHLHRKRIRHADIKPANVLVEESQLFISDFSISREVVSEPDSTSSSNSPNTPMYAAPEIARSQRHGRKADIFSLGCVYLELVTVTLLGTLAGLYTYLGMTAAQKDSRPSYEMSLHLVMNWLGALRQRSDEPYAPLLDLCRSMLQFQPTHRPDAATVVEIMAAITYPPQALAPTSTGSGLGFPSSEPVRAFEVYHFCMEPGLGVASVQHGVDPHRASKADPIKRETHGSDEKHTLDHWPYKSPPESGKARKQYHGQQSRREIDLLGLEDDTFQAEAPPSYSEDLDCLLAASGDRPYGATDERLLAKVLQPDDEYGQHPHERWLHGTTCPPFLPTERLPPTHGAEAHTVCTSAAFPHLGPRPARLQPSKLCIPGFDPGPSVGNHAAARPAPTHYISASIIQASATITAPTSVNLACGMNVEGRSKCAAPDNAMKPCVPDNTWFGHGVAVAPHKTACLDDGMPAQAYGKDGLGGLGGVARRAHSLQVGAHASFNGHFRKASRGSSSSARRLSLSPRTASKREFRPLSRPAKRSGPGRKSECGSVPGAGDDKRPLPVARAISASSTADSSSSSAQTSSTWPPQGPVSSLLSMKRVNRILGRNGSVDLDSGVPLAKASSEGLSPAGPRKPPLRHRRSNATLDSPGSEFKPYGRHANQWLFGDFSVRAAVRDALGRAGRARRAG